MEKPGVSHSRDSSVSDSKHKEVNRMASLRVQQQLLQSQEPLNRQWRTHPHSTEVEYITHQLYLGPLMMFRNF